MWIGLAVLVFGLAACSIGGRSAARTDRTVTVLAAASLHRPFAELERSYEAAHPGTDVVMSFGPSIDLVRQVHAGAPADVLATADEVSMEVLGPRARNAAPLATNSLAILVPSGNPGRVRSLADLADPRRTVVLCAVEVPCGRMAARALEEGGVTVTPASFERDVQAVAGRVRLGEADAGIGYVTEASGPAGGVEAIPLPPGPGVTLRSPVVSLSGRGDGFVRLVLSEEGRRVLASAGFGPP